MKKLFTLLFIGIFIVSCSKDDDKVTAPINLLPTTPTAKAAYDNNNYGIYKGVFVGSSGTVMVNIKNDNALNAVLKINGVATVYTTTETVTEGQATYLTFTNGSNSFEFYVNGEGVGSEISNINIAGHPNAAVNMLKEMSDALVECFEGTYSGNDTGVFNIAVINWSATEGEIAGLAHSTPDDQTFWVWGEINSNVVTGEFEGGNFTGNRVGNNLAGNWSNSSSESGTWTGTRTL